MNFLKIVHIGIHCMCTLGQRALGCLNVFLVQNAKRVNQIICLRDFYCTYLFCFFLGSLWKHNPLIGFVLNFLSVLAKWMKWGSLHLNRCTHEKGPNSQLLKSLPCSPSKQAHFKKGWDIKKLLSEQIALHLTRKSTCSQSSSGLL